MEPTLFPTVDLTGPTTTFTSNMINCMPAGKSWVYIFLMPFPVLSILINIIVWLAATFYRRRLLRQSYVYLCVTSTLLSHVIFLCFHLWDEVEGYKLSSGPRNPSQPAPGELMKKLWSLCTAASVSMLFVVCGNLTVLVYVMLESVYFRRSVRSSSASTMKTKRSRATTELESKRRRAIFLIAFVWVLPFILTLAAVFKWNCTSCLCSQKPTDEMCFKTKGCSRTWMPMTNSFIAVNVALWFLEVIILFFVAFTGLKKFQNNQSVKDKKFFSLEDFSGSKKCQTGNLSGLCAFQTLSSSGSASAPPSRSKEENDDVFYLNNEAPPSTCSFFPKKPRFRLASMLVFTFIIFTVMLPAAFFVDISIDDYPASNYRFTSMVLVQLYTLVCPLLLVRYMSNLKSAVVQMLSAVLCCFHR